MAYYQADEIRRLIENWASWTGDGAGQVYSTSPIAWTDEAYAKREARAGFVVKVIGVDAQLAHEALQDMDAKHAKALKLYYLSPLTAETVARKYFRCGRRTYYYLVERAHPEFWSCYCTRKDRSATRPIYA